MTEGRDARRIVIVEGQPPHSDPWHALDATAAAIAETLADMGTVRVASTTDPASWDDADLLVLNVGGDLEAPAPSSLAQVDAVVAHRERGRPVLAFHSSAIAFRSDDRWRLLLGGRWVPGVTMHPQIGSSLVQPVAGPVPADAPLVAADFVVYDERYTGLEVASDVQALAVHTEDGRTHPLIWWRRQREGRGAVVYDALGHGVESYESPGHRAWIRSCVRSLLGADGAGGAGA